MIWGLHVIVGLSIFAIGTVVGSFLNVCIYRLPWQKSVVWPDSRCPACLGSISARDNIPVLSWFILRGECRTCGAPFSVRYPAVEALVGLLFVGVFLVDVAAEPAGLIQSFPNVFVLRMVYHLILVALLVVASLIDFDLFIIPDAITLPGMVVGLAMGTLVPQIRPEPSTAQTYLGGLWMGALGLIVGGGLVWLIRILGSKVFRREAMGFGDVTLLGMIGSFLGWQVAVLSVFLAAFLGLGPALGRLTLNLVKLLRGRKLTGADREIPFGPYLSMAAIVLMLGWPWIWKAWARQVFSQLSDLPVVFWYMIGLDR